MARRLLEAGAAIGSTSAYTRARIAARLPAYGQEIDGRSNPLELGLHELVDFDKGCYIGQEVIARLENYEKVQRRRAPAHGSARSRPMTRSEARVWSRASRLAQTVGAGWRWRWSRSACPMGRTCSCCPIEAMQFGPASSSRASRRCDRSACKRPRHPGAALTRSSRHL